MSFRFWRSIRNPSRHSAQSGREEPQRIGWNWGVAVHGRDQWQEDFCGHPGKRPFLEQKNLSCGNRHLLRRRTDRARRASLSKDHLYKGTHCNCGRHANCERCLAVRVVKIAGSESRSAKEDRASKLSQKRSTGTSARECRKVGSVSRARTIRRRAVRSSGNHQRLRKTASARNGTGKNDSRAPSPSTTKEVADRSLSGDSNWLLGDGLGARRLYLVNSKPTSSFRCQIVRHLR